MPLSDDIAGQGLTIAEKSFEIAKELITSLLDFQKSHKIKFSQAISKISDVINKKNENYIANATGEISLKRLNRSRETYLMQGHIATKDINAIIEKAKEYNIPVAFKGKGGETVTAIFLDRQKGQFEQIMKEVLEDKLALNPNDYLAFKANVTEARVMMDLCKKNDVPITVVKGVDGELRCIYEAKDVAKINILKSDCKAVEEHISKKFDVEKVGNKIRLSDSKIGKSITLSALPTRAKLERIMQEQFNYTSDKAVAASDKFAKQLSGDSLMYFKSDNRQAILMNNFERNIQLADDTIATRPYTFTRANYTSENVNHYLINDGDKTVKLTPAQMTKSEMVDLVQTKLSISDAETVSAIVEKTQKIDTLQKIKDLRAEKGLKGENYSIERLTNNKFTVEQNGRKQMYSLSRKKEALAEIKADFKISDEKAEKIFDKAKHQNAITNELKKASVNSPKINKKDKSVGARR